MNNERAPWEERINPVRMALEQALELIEQGLPCFPCNAKKEPLCKHSFKRATRDADELRQLWQGAWQPAVRIGVATGEPSGLFCLDIDTARHPEAVQWHDKFREDIPATRLHKTESGGWHYLFQHHPGLKCTGSKIEIGIDTRGDGGYVIWWPAHVVSIEHRFLPAAPVPEWLIEALTPPPPLPSWLSHTQRARAHSSAPPDTRLEGILTAVAHAQVNVNRNALTFWGACRIRDMIAEGELDQISGAAAFDALAQVACSTGLSHSEVNRTIQSAVRT